jgi:hypothetical protein
MHDMQLLRGGELSRAWRTTARLTVLWLVASGCTAEVSETARVGADSLTSDGRASVVATDRAKAMTLRATVTDGTLWVTVDGFSKDHHFNLFLDTDGLGDGRQAEDGVELHRAPGFAIGEPDGALVHRCPIA